MADIVERIAIAQNAFAVANGYCKPWDKISSEQRNAALILARVAIEAMLQPTPSMIEAGQREAQVVSIEYKDDGMLMVDVHRPYRAMIVAALRDAPVGFIISNQIEFADGTVLKNFVGGFDTFNEKPE